jgi:cytochrome bd-type quinol oxidase subunit 2
MIKFWLIILRIVCILQLLLAVFHCLSSLTGFLSGEFIFLFQAIAFALIAALPVFTFAVLNQNFPDRAIEGRRKRHFNRLFLVNVMLVSFLFGFVFLDLKDGKRLSRALGIEDTQNLFLFIPFLVSCVMLFFHFSILFGLAWLRRYINSNTRREQFDFEMQDGNS